MDFLKILTFILILFSKQSFALKEDFFLQGAAGYAGTSLRTQSLRDNAGGANFTTHGGFHFGDIDVIFTSQILLAEYSKVNIQENNIDYRISAEFHSFALGPLIRYFTDLRFRGWNFFLAGGYLWSISTVKLDKSTFENSNSDVNDDTKFTFRGHGPTASVGFVQDKEDYPLFVDFTFKRLVSRDIRFIEITKDGRLSVEKRAEDLKHDFIEETISLNFGVEFL